jgi:hypothetical protein
VSAKHRKRADGEKPKRNPLEYHSTPSWARRLLWPFALDALGGRTDPIVIDAGCGKGEWGETLLSMRPDVHLVGFEKHKTRAIIAHRTWCAARASHQARLCKVVWGDFLVPSARLTTVEDGETYPAIWAMPPADIVVSNPPFTRAEGFLDRAKHLLAPGGVVALYLKLDWMAGVDKHARHLRERPDAFVLSRRPSHRPDGQTDAQQYALFLYGPRSSGRWQPVLPTDEQMSLWQPGWKPRHSRPK